MKSTHNHQHGLRIPATRYLSATLFRSPLFHMLLIILIGVLVYANTLQAPFELDDNTYITHENMRINPTDILDGGKLIHGSRLSDTFKTGLLTRRFGFLTFMLNYKLHGLSTLGFHLFNTFIHLVTALLVYALINRCWHTPFIDSCFQRAQEERERLSRWTSFLGAALFVAHPVNTQAITYIIQRFASLATMLYLLALLAYMSSALRRERVPSSILYGIALIAAVLAMLTKEISFTLPVVMLLCDRLFLQRPLRQTLLAITPFLLTMAIIPWNLFQAKFILASSAGELSGSIGALSGNATLSRHDYFLTELRVIVTYIRLLLFPVNQNLDYDYPVYTSLFAPPVLASLLLLLSIATVGFVLLRSSAVRSGRLAGLYRLSAFGIFWFFMTLSVESSIQPIENTIYEHRLYLPSFGFILAILCAGALLWLRVVAASPAKARLVPVAGLTAVVILGFVAADRNAVWQDKITLWEDAALKSQNKSRVHANLGQAYLLKNRIDEAQRHTERALQLSSLNATAYQNLGLISALRKQYDKALQNYRKAFDLDPAKTDILVDIGKIHQLRGNLPDAIAAYQDAISLNRISFDAHYNLGLVYDSLKEYSKALGEYLQAQTLRSDYAPLYNNLGVTYANLGQYDKALESFQKTLNLDPFNRNALNNMQVISAKKRSSH